MPNYIDGLLQGSKWSDTNLTYSLWDVGYTWNKYGKELFDAALSTIEYYTNLNFTYVSNVGLVNTTTDIEAILSGSFLQENVGYGVIGMAVFPSTDWGNAILGSFGTDRASWPNVEGSIFYDNDHYAYFAGSAPAGQGFATIIHEVLHALGLKHPQHNGGSGEPTFGELGMSDYDNQVFTIMSYNDSPISTVSSGNPSTPMLFDVAALQYLYGANMSAYAGNDTHVFSDNGINGTLWDAGGTDTIDASGLLVSATIDLHAGSYSYTENTYVAMAYNMTIEHAIGGAAADRIDGNDADNHIYGMNGGDTLLGFGGNDYVAGGNGSDVILGNHGYDALEGGLGADSMVGGNTLIDPLDNSDNIIGGEGNDHIYGCGGDDTIDAGAGIDLIVGCDGNDTLTGGAGNDIFVYINNDGNDVISDWQNGDIISISRTANIQSFSNLASRIVSVGNDTEISLEASVSILLAGVQQSALDAGDFYFWG